MNTGRGSNPTAASVAGAPPTLTSGLSPQGGVDDVTTLLHSTCYQTPVRYRIRRRPTARGDQASETASPGGKMAHVSDPRQGGGGGGPDGRTGSGRFSRPRRRRIGIGATVILGHPPPNAPVPPGGTSPTTKPIRALEDPCKGSSRSSPTPRTIGLTHRRTPQGLALRIGVSGQLLDASTSCPSLPTRRVASSTLAW